MINKVFNGYEIDCDVCKKKVGDFEYFQDTLDYMKTFRWDAQMLQKDEWKVICPDCCKPSSGIPQIEKIKEESSKKRKNIINMDVPLNKRYQNENIRFGNPGEKVLLANNFRKLDSGNWICIKMVLNEPDTRKSAGIRVSMSTTLDPKTGKAWVDIIDEDFLQPFDYQKIICSGSSNRFAHEVHSKVQGEMMKLLSQGIITGYVAGDYI